MKMRFCSFSLFLSYLVIAASLSSGPAFGETKPTEEYSLEKVGVVSQDPLWESADMVLIVKPIHEESIVSSELFTAGNQGSDLRSDWGLDEDTVLKMLKEDGEVTFL